MIFLQEGEPIHARHLDVQRDHVGQLLADALGATKGSPAVPMTSISGSLEAPRQRVWRTTAESSTIRTRIFSHQWVFLPTFGHAFDPAFLDSLKAGDGLAACALKAPSPVSTQPAQQNLSRARIESNVDAAFASQAGGGYLKAFFFENSQRRLAVEAPHRRPAWLRGCTGRTSAAEELDLDLFAGRTKSVQSPRAIS
jgi:hypothetical protein